LEWLGPGWSEREGPVEKRGEWDFLGSLCATGSANAVFPLTFNEETALPTPAATSFTSPRFSGPVSGGCSFRGGDRGSGWKVALPDDEYRIEVIVHRHFIGNGPFRCHFIGSGCEDRFLTVVCCVALTDSLTDSNSPHFIPPLPSKSFEICPTAKTESTKIVPC